MHSGSKTCVAGNAIANNNGEKETVEHRITIPPAEFDYLSRGEKHFLLLRDTTPPLHYGDVLIFTNRHLQDCELPLVRHIRFIESGLGLAQNWVCAELQP